MRRYKSAIHLIKILSRLIGFQLVFNLRTHPCSDQVVHPVKNIQIGMAFVGARSLSE